MANVLIGSPEWVSDAIGRVEAFLARPYVRPPHTHRWPWNEGGRSLCVCGVLAPWLRLRLPPPDIGPDVPGGGAV